MRILVTVTNDLSHDQRMHRICQSLQAAGHAVDLIGRQLPNSPPLSEQAYRQTRIRCRWNSGKAFYAEMNARLVTAVNANAYDLIYSVDLDTMLAGRILSKGNRKWLYDAHEWFSETPEVHPRPLIRRTWRTLGRWLVPRTDARITVGPELAVQLADDYGANFSVVRNVPHRSNFTKSENAGVVIYQGMLNPGRGLEQLIEAMAYLPTEKLWLVGDGPERERLQRRCDVLQLNDRIWFAGFWPPERLPELTARAWLGVNLLEASSPSYYYSLANKSLDYIQAGLPSIQMQFPEYRAINQGYGCFRLLPELRVDLLVKEIFTLRQSPELYDELQQNCQIAAQDLCWEKEEAELLRIIDALKP